MKPFLLVRAACMHSHGTKCQLLTAFFLFISSSDTLTFLQVVMGTKCPHFPGLMGIGNLIFLDLSLYLLNILNTFCGFICPQTRQS